MCRVRELISSSTRGTVGSATRKTRELSLRSGVTRRIAVAGSVFGVVLASLVAGTTAVPAAPQTPQDALSSLQHAVKAAKQELGHTGEGPDLGHAAGEAKDIPGKLFKDEKAF